MPIDGFDRIDYEWMVVEVAFTVDSTWFVTFDQKTMLGTVYCSSDMIKSWRHILSGVDTSPDTPPSGGNGDTTYG